MNECGCCFALRSLSQAKLKCHGWFIASSDKMTVDTFIASVSRDEAVQVSDFIQKHADQIFKESFFFWNASPRIVCC